MITIGSESNKKATLLYKTLTNIVKNARILNGVFCNRLKYSYLCKTSGIKSAIRIIEKSLQG